jgi:O-antigen/teichoic acid export membrane protein
MGHYFVAVAVTRLLGILSEFGMRDPLIRELHLRPDRMAQTVGVAFAFRLTMSLPVLVGCALVIRWGGYSPELASLVWFFGGAEVLNGLAQVFYMLFRARERMDYESLNVALERGMVAVIGGGLVALGVGRMELFGAVALGAAVVHLLVSGGLAVGKFTRFRLHFDRTAWKGYLALLLPFAAANILNLLYYRLDTLLLKAWSAKGTQAVAWYGIAYSWVMALTIFPGAMMGAAFPHFARTSAPDADARAHHALAVLYTRSWKLMLTVGVPVAITTSLCATKLMGFFYSTSLYPPGTIDGALRVLAWVEGLLFLSAIVSNVLRAANRRKAILLLIALTTLVNVGANAWAIPRYHHVGAAWSLVVSEAFFVLVGSSIIRLRLARWTEWRFLPRLLLAWSAGTLALWWAMPLPLAVQAPIAGGVYCAAVYLLRIMRREDWTLRVPTGPELAKAAKDL